MKVQHNRTERWQAFAAAAAPGADDVIRTGYAAKRRARDIAADLGGEWTAMRVAYRAKALGLEARYSAEMAAKKGFAPPRSPRPQSESSRAGGIAIAILRGSAKAKASATPARTAPPLSFADVAECGCRFPIGDPRLEGFRFCNAPREAGRVYCAACCSIAYRRLKAEAA